MPYLRLVASRLVYRLRTLFDIRGLLSDSDREVTPVVMVNDVVHFSPRIVRSAEKTGNGSATIYTVPSNVNAYVFFVRGSLHRANTDAETTYEVTGVIDGTRQQLWHFLGKNLTADRYSSGGYIPPIRLDAGTTVLASIDGASPASTFRGTVFIYEEPII